MRKDYLLEKRVFQQSTGSGALGGFFLETLSDHVLSKIRIRTHTMFPQVYNLEVLAKSLATAVSIIVIATS